MAKVCALFAGQSVQETGMGAALLKKPFIYWAGLAVGVVGLVYFANGFFLFFCESVELSFFPATIKSFLHFYFIITIKQVNTFFN